VEPQSLINNNYPNDYSTGVWGSPNGTGMFGLAAKGLADEVYALYVNQNSTLFTENPLLLSQQTAASILTHQVTNWSQVFDINNHAVVSGSLAITIVNREFGSGSRAATDILVVGDACGSGGNSSVTIFNKASATRYFATGDVLKAANSVPGAITYASIDNATGTGNQSNLVWVSLNGIQPSNLAAAQGIYPFWVEAQYVNNASNTGADSIAVNNIVSAIQNEQTTAALADILAIPAVVNANGSPANFNTTVHLNPSLTGLVPSGGGTATVYINPYTRHGVTCNNPVYTVNQVP
jgi:hypothetical protein